LVAGIASFSSIRQNFVHTPSTFAYNGEARKIIDDQDSSTKTPFMKFGLVFMIKSLPVIYRLKVAEIYMYPTNQEFWL